MPFNSLTDRTDVAGLIPDEYSSTIIQSLPAASAAMSIFRKVNVPTGTLHMPVISVLPTAYWVGATDTALKQTTEVNWDNIDLIIRELAVIVPIPQAVVDDAQIDLWGEVRPRLAEAFGVKIDQATIFGTDAPSGFGDSVVEVAVAAGNVVDEGDTPSPADDLAGDIFATWAEVEDDGYDVNFQLARRNVRSRLRNLRATDGTPIWQPGNLSAGFPASIGGEDLFYVSNGAWDNAYTVVVGDRNAAILGIRQDIEYRIFTEGVISDDSGNVVLNLMQQDAIAMRATMRVGFATAAPINRVNGDDNTRAPFAVLTSDAS